jgi:hypothetical protein
MSKSFLPSEACHRHEHTYSSLRAHELKTVERAGQYLCTRLRWLGAWCPGRVACLPPTRLPETLISARIHVGVEHNPLEHVLRLFLPALLPKSWVILRTRWCTCILFMHI